MQTIHRISIYAIGILLIGFISGCSKNSTGPTAAGGNPNVSLSVLFSRTAPSGVFKTAGTQAVDSLRIDSAVVVFSRITFEARIDTVAIDTMGDDFDDVRGKDTSIVFNGPFVVHIRDTTAINFASQTVPPGTYDGIRFTIHRLMPGDPFQDSDDRFGGMVPSDTSAMGSSITVWGEVKKNGVMTPFTYRLDASLTFKLRGTFTVPAATSTYNIALNFDMGRWFTNPFDGAILDPTDLFPMNQAFIRHAIIMSFMNGRGGHNRGDGHPDGDGNGYGG